MRLHPAAAPGHLNRKAREFEDEIAQLRSQGYTLSAIRESLAAIGVQVSLSAVWREVSRAKRGDSKSSTQNRALTADDSEPRGPKYTVASAATPLPNPISTPAVVDCRSGKDIAEEFRRRQTTNPLLRAKEQR